MRGRRIGRHGQGVDLEEKGGEGRQGRGWHHETGEVPGTVVANPDVLPGCSKLIILGGRGGR